MKLLGKTYREVLNSIHLDQEERDALSEYLMKSFDLRPDELEDILDSDTNEGYFTTGRYFMIEDADDLAQMALDTGCDDLTETPYVSAPRLDLAMYLNKKETSAILMQVTGNEGGDIYFVNKEILEEFPSIHSHIFEANQ